MSPDALQVLFDELGQSAFTFVVIHAPPLLESEGCRTWARHVDALVVVSRLDDLRKRIDAEPKSTKWKLRARVGERVQWYETPEEVG